MKMRLRYQQMGGHYHCRLFTALYEGGTYSLCGTLVFDEREWNEVVITFECGGAEVLPEGAEPA